MSPGRVPDSAILYSYGIKNIHELHLNFCLSALVIVGGNAIPVYWWLWGVGKKKEYSIVVSQDISQSVLFYTIRAKKNQKIAPELLPRRSGDFVGGWKRLLPSVVRKVG